jgi:hypothetical protein
MWSFSLAKIQLTQAGSEIIFGRRFSIPGPAGLSGLPWPAYSSTPE